MFDRSDGLLRGSRDERGEQMKELGAQPWSLDVLLKVHAGLLDHAEAVRASAMQSLIEIAKRTKEPVGISPIDLVLYFRYGWTAASGIFRDILTLMLDLDTAGSRKFTEQLVTSDCRNEDFEWFVRYAIVLRLPMTAFRPVVLEE